MQLEKSKNNRSRSMSKPHSYACEDTTKIAVSSFMGYLKGKSSLIIYEKYPELKYKYRNREFWCRGYYADTAGKNAQKIQKYIKRQLEEDQTGEQ